MNYFESSANVEDSAVCQNEARKILKSFVSQEFGTVRVVILNDKSWFVGKDVAAALGYSNPQKAIRDHVDDEDKGVNELFTPGGKQKLGIVNESGLYSLILFSKLPTAKKFKRWITHEVIPSIERHGAYIESQTLEKMICSPEFGIRLLTVIKEEREKNQKIMQENEKLNLVNQGLVHQAATWSIKPCVLNALIRSLACSAFNKNYRYAYNTFYKELSYKKGISLKQRGGDSKAIDKIHENEWDDVFEVVVSLCERNGVNISKVVNEVNAERIVK